MLYGDTGSNAPVLGLHRFYTSSLAQLLVASGGSLYVGDDLGQFTEIHSGLAGGRWYQFATWSWKELCFIANGENKLLQWDGEDIQEVSGDPPISQFVVEYANRLFVAGDPSSPTTLRWSELGDHETWPAENFAEASGPIQGLVAGFGQLYIFSPDRVEVLVGTGGAETTEGIYTLVDGIGCVAPRSIASWSGRTYFLAHDGVRYFDGARTKLVSQRIEPEVKRQSVEQRRAAVGAIYNGRYWLSWREPRSFIPNNLIYVYDIENEWWTKFDSIYATSLLALSGAQDEETLLSGDHEGRVWYQDRGASDNGEQIISSYRTGIFIPYPGMVTQLRRVRLQTVNQEGDVVVRWTLDEGEADGQFDFPVEIEGSFWGSAVWGQSTWSKLPGAVVHRDSFPMSAIGRALQFEVLMKGSGRWQMLQAELRAKRRV